MIRSGAPMKDKTIPTGNVSGDSTVLETISADISNIEPTIIDVGIK